MRRLLLAGSLLVTAPLAAQAGTATWSVRTTLPDTLQATAGFSEVELLFTTATDGERLGFQMTVGPTMAASFVAMDLSTARFQVVTNAAGDSLAMGIVMPPDLAAQMGGGIGFRIDMAIPDSVPVPFAGMNMDSLMSAPEAETPSVINTGRTDTVAGLGCEIWTMSGPTDSIPVDSVAITTCLAEPTPALTAISELMLKRLPKLGLDIEQMREMGRKYYGGRELVPIRMVLSIGTMEFVMQLESLSETSPGQSFFTLPEGLQPFPIEMFTGMMQQAMPQQDTTAVDGDT